MTAAFLSWSRSQPLEPIKQPRARTRVPKLGDEAACFAHYRVPELYAGLQRDPTNFPVQYLGANVPQAWAAGSVFAFLRAILGLRPDAPSDRLYIDPVLPDWLSNVVVTDLRVGKRCFDLRFWRDNRDTRWQVLRGEADLVAHRSFATGAQL